jgi:hypothetical protein
MPVPALGGMNVPAGLTGVTQCAVLIAGAAHRMNSPMTISLTTTMTLLNRDVSRIPATSSELMKITTTIAGTFTTAPVNAYVCDPAS